jgi:hypothetical protein
MALDDVLQRFAGDVLHDHPLVAHLVGADVEQADEVRVLQVEALGDAAELDFEIAANELQGDFLARVAGGEIDFAKAAAPHSALDRVTFQRTRSAGVREFHVGSPAAGDRRAPGTLRVAPPRLVEFARRKIHGRKVLSF